MTQKTLAQAAGVSEATIQSIEHGRATPNVATLEALLDVFGSELVVKDYGEA